MKSRKYTNALVTDGAQVYESPRVPGTHCLRSAGSMESLQGQCVGARTRRLRIRVQGMLSNDDHRYLEVQTQPKISRIPAYVVADQRRNV